MKCPSCQAPITQDDVFCGSCGRRLTAQDKVPSAVQPSSLPPMPGPPPIQPPAGGGVPPYQQPVTPMYAPPPQQPVIQPSYQQPQVIQPVSYAQQPQPLYQAPQPAKKKMSGCVIVAIVVVVLVLCGGLVLGAVVLLPQVLPSADPTAIRAVEPYQPPVDNGSASSGAEVALDVVNGLDVSVCYLYVSPSSSDSWGEDWLWDIGTIPPGTNATFSIASGGTVDIRAEDCDGNMIDEQYNVYVYPEGLTYTLSP